MDFLSWCFMWRLGAFVAVLLRGTWNSFYWLQELNSLQHTVLERGICFHVKCSSSQYSGRNCILKDVSSAYGLHLADHRLQFEGLKSWCELKSYVVSPKCIRNPCLDICKLGAAQIILLTLKYRLHKHPALLSRVVVSMKVNQAGAEEQLC